MIGEMSGIRVCNVEDRIKNSFAGLAKGRIFLKSSLMNRKVLMIFMVFFAFSPGFARVKCEGVVRHRFMPTSQSQTAGLFDNSLEKYGFAAGRKFSQSFFQLGVIRHLSGLVKNL